MDKLVSLSFRDVFVISSKEATCVTPVAAVAAPLGFSAVADVPVVVQAAPTCSCNDLSDPAKRFTEQQMRDLIFCKNLHRQEHQHAINLLSDKVILNCKHKDVKIGVDKMVRNVLFKEEGGALHSLQGRSAVLSSVVGPAEKSRAGLKVFMFPMRMLRTMFA